MVQPYTKLPSLVKIYSVRAFLRGHVFYFFTTLESRKESRSDQISAATTRGVRGMIAGLGIYQNVPQYLDYRAIYYYISSITHLAPISTWILYCVYVYIVQKI